MIVLQERDKGWFAAFVCDECKGPIEDADDAVAVVRMSGSWSLDNPQVIHIHNGCRDQVSLEDEETRFIPLREYIRAVIDSF